MKEDGGGGKEKREKKNRRERQRHLVFVKLALVRSPIYTDFAVTSCDPARVKYARFVALTSQAEEARQGQGSKIAHQRRLRGLPFLLPTYSLLPRKDLQCNGRDTL
ncbi:hypothetical protein KC365_g107 [Hortaea werneckii]|nr:hypothetical protein KC339_g101 [Hortaea werneckii]KAI7245922.1 hypothetical protein KC365_g107 [Hortaea werneckii]